MSAIGARVTALLHATPAVVKSHGSGVYLGHFMHPEHRMGVARIKLDSGKTIWGINCWYAPEAQVEDYIASRYPNAEITLI